MLLLRTRTYSFSPLDRSTIFALGLKKKKSSAFAESRARKFHRCCWCCCCNGHTRACILITRGAEVLNAIFFIRPFGLFAAPDSPPFFLLHAQACYFFFPRSFIVFLFAPGISFFFSFSLFNLLLLLREPQPPTVLAFLFPRCELRYMQLLRPCLDVNPVKMPPTTFLKLRSREPFTRRGQLHCSLFILFSS